MHIQSINYDDRLTMTSFLSFVSLFIFFLLFFFALTFLRDYFKQVKKNRSYENLNELEKQLFHITKKNTQYNSKKITIEAPLLANLTPKRKKNNTNKKVLIQEQINIIHYINVNLKPSIK